MYQYYLTAQFPNEHQRRAFYKTESEDTAKTLAALFKREYGQARKGEARPLFKVISDANLPVTDQVLFSEAVDIVKADAEHADCWTDGPRYPEGIRGVLARWYDRACKWEQTCTSPAGAEADLASRPDLTKGRNMPTNVSLSPGVIDELLGLIQWINSALEPLPLPPPTRRSRTLWERVLREARAELEAATKERAKLVIGRPYGIGDAPSKMKTEARQQQRNQTVRELAERKYRQASPALRKATETRRRGLDAKMSRLDELLTWHRPALDAQGYRKMLETVHPAAINAKPFYNPFRDALSRCLREIRLKMERADLKANATGQDGKEVPWRDDAPEYLHLTKAVRLTDGLLKVPTLSKLLTPDGEMRYMRKKGIGCKVHIADFRRHMQGHQSDPKWAKAYQTYLTASGKGDLRFFWQCRKCAHEYPDNANAPDHCPKCGGEHELVSKKPPEPRR